MAQTWDSKLLRHQRDIDAQLTASLNDLGRLVGRIVLRAGSATNDDGQRAIPNRRAEREALRGAIWREALKPYFIGAGDDAFDGSAPRSPYGRLLVAGIRGAVRIQAERQVAVIQRATRRYPRVQQWLLEAGRPRQAEFAPELSKSKAGGSSVMTRSICG